MGETVVLALISICLGLSALLAVVRIVRGPSVLDRTVSSEVLVTTVVCALGAWAAIHRSATTLPIVISLSLVGFLGSVSVARFVPPSVREHRADDVPPGGDR